MDLCLGGELFGLIINQGCFTETCTATVMHQLIPAGRYMHDKGVCHRDLKPENVLLMNQGPLEGNVVKLGGFSHAKRFQSGQVMTTMVGSPHYIAPQVLAGSYNH